MSITNKTIVLPENKELGYSERAFIIKKIGAYHGMDIIADVISACGGVVGEIGSKKLDVSQAELVGKEFMGMFSRVDLPGIKRVRDDLLQYIDYVNKASGCMVPLSKSNVDMYVCDVRELFTLLSSVVGFNFSFFQKPLQDIVGGLVREGTKTTG